MHRLPQIIKRAFDLLVVIFGILLFSPLFVLLALWVKMGSRGPVFFRQVRVGLNGREFRIFKFRTMVTDAEQRGSQVTSGNDTRITGAGRVLRKYKLDELPQLFNVLLGDMSLVGPRPEVPKFVRFYTQEQRQVLRVRPGITGVSQLEFRHEEELLAGQEDVEGFYIAAVMPAKLRLDLRYVQNNTFGNDLNLLFRTFVALFRKSSEAQPNLSPQ